MQLSNCNVLVLKNLFPGNSNDSNSPARANCYWSRQFYMGDDLVTQLTTSEVEPGARRPRLPGE